jgi:hypothetical protein
MVNKYLNWWYFHLLEKGPSEPTPNSTYIGGALSPLSCVPMLVPITIIVITHITHNIEISCMVQHIQTTSLFRVKVLLNQIMLQNYLMEIHHGLTLWFQSKRTNKSSANVNPIVICVFVILQMPSQM